MNTLRLWKEVELEHYVAGDIAALADVMFTGGENHLDLVGTQIPCMYGDIDMICTWRNTIFVIEFKAVKADESTVGQVCRYASAINAIADPYQHIPSDLFDTIAPQVWLHVQPVVVAPHFDKRVFMSDCMLIQAKRLESGAFELSRAVSPQRLLDKEHLNKPLEKSLTPFLLGLVGEAVGHTQARNLRTVTNISVSVN